MENKNSISHLTSNWWYRLIKVVYLFFLVIALIGFSAGIFFSFSPEYDNNRSYIKCANGKEFVLSENGITLYSDFMWSTDRDKAVRLCSDIATLTEPQRTQLDGIVLKMDSDGASTPDIQVIVNDFKQKYGQPSPNSGKYELVSKYTNRNWVAIIGFSLLSIVATLLFFEVIRRIFYYIVLGSLRPKK